MAKKLSKEQLAKMQEARKRARRVQILHTDEAKSSTGGLTPDQRRWLARIPKSKQLMSSKALRGAAPIRLAVKVKCLDCCGWEGADAEVANCPVELCPLWHYRPFQGKGKSGEKEH